MPPETPFISCRIHFVAVAIRSLLFSPDFSFSGRGYFPSAGEVAPGWAFEDGCTPAAVAYATGVSSLSSQVRESEREREIRFDRIPDTACRHFGQIRRFSSLRYNIGSDGWTRLCLQASPSYPLAEDTSFVARETDLLDSILYFVAFTLDCLKE